MLIRQMEGHREHCDLRVNVLGVFVLDNASEFPVIYTVSGCICAEVFLHCHVLSFF